MSTSQHTCQIAHDVLGQYISIGMEEPETPHQFPPQPTNPPTAPTPIETNTFVHIPDSPALSPSPFQYLPQEVSTMGCLWHPKKIYFSPSCPPFFEHTFAFFQLHGFPAPFQHTFSWLPFFEHTFTFFFQLPGLPAPFF